MTRRNGRWCALLLCALAVAGCRDVADPQRTHHGAMALDLRALARALGAQSVMPGTVIDSVRLAVSGAGNVQAYGRRLETRDPVVAFNVTATTGSNRFTAEVFSTRRIPLFAGDTTVSIEANGFQVQLNLHAVAPVLVLNLDNLQVAPGRTDSTLVVRNAGLGLLDWAIAGIAPNVCTATSGAQTPCLLPRPAQGRLPAGGSIRVEFTVAALPPSREHIVTFESGQGAIALPVIVR